MIAVCAFALSGPLLRRDGDHSRRGVLLDAFLVRLLLLPVLMRYAGRVAWWQPTWLDRILPDVRFGH